MLFLIHSFIKCLSFELNNNQNNNEKEINNSKIMKINDFLFTTKIDNLNLFKIEKFIQKSEIIKKVFLIFIYLNFLKLNGFFDKMNKVQFQHGN